jgi:thiamine pyrophosphate-dependent acetolactate synthase large subunit-like protein
MSALTESGQNGQHGLDYTAAEALLEALIDAGVTHLIVNLGSDHPAFIEVFSKWKAEGRDNQLRIITAPHEFVGLCMAQGYYQASGKMQAMIVHVDAGTLNMGGAIHNVARARIPVLMISGESPSYQLMLGGDEYLTQSIGMSPATDDNELVGSRNVRSRVSRKKLD